MTDEHGENRRRYPRVKTPMFCRTARFRRTRRPVVDVGLGGVRVYSDEKFRQGERLDLELCLPEGEPLMCLMRVAWLRELGPTGPAVYDVGLELLEVRGEGGVDRLAQVLDTDG